MGTHNTKSEACKGILRFLVLLLCASVAVLLVTSPPPASAQTTNWTGVAGDVWTRPDSWNNGTPSISSIAVIDGGSGTTLALRESNSPGGVSVGTLILTNPSYISIVTGASAATVNFGTNAAVVYDRSTTIEEKVSGSKKRCQEPLIAGGE